MTLSPPPRNAVLPPRLSQGLPKGMLLVAAVVCVSVFILALALTLYAHTQTDDMFRVIHTRRYGYWGAVGNYYAEWGGRWLGWLGGVAPLEWFGIHRSYPALLMATLLFLAASVATLARFAAALSWRTSAVVGMAVPALTFGRAKEAGDFFYWYTGAWENQVGVGLPLLSLGLLLRGGRISGIVGVMGMALTAGIHELYGLFAIAALLPATACAFTSRMANRWWWVAALGLALVSFGVSVGAPGNTTRAAQMDAAWSLGPALKLSIEQFLDVARRWILDGVTLCALVLVAVSGLRRPEWCDRPVIRIAGWNVRWELVLPMLTLALLGGAIVAHAYATGVQVPGRTRCAVQVAFLTGALGSAVVFTAGRLPRLPGAQAIAAGALALTVLLMPNVEMGLRDLTTNAPRYDRAMRQRHEQLLKAAAGDGHAVLTPLPPIPWVYWDQSVTNDPTDYRNYHTRMYYDLKSVRVERP